VTRYGVLSDVHANLQALEAVLTSLDRSGVDRILVAGDLVGYGAQPNECIAVLREAGALCVAGNHDLFLAGRLPAARLAPRARLSLEVQRRLLSEDVRAYLASLPQRLHHDGVLVTHGSLDSPEEYVRDETRALELLDRLPQEAPGADTLVLGHTHRQACVLTGRGAVRPRRAVPVRGAVRLVNPGSVGQSRQHERRPRARFAVYDSGAGVVHFSSTDYDVEAARAALRRLDLPDRCLHAPPRLRHRLGGILSRLRGGERPDPRPPAPAG
jgi:predicted phosphodiesterase